MIFDSGASTCATSDASLIDDIVYGNGVKATRAFGPPLTSQASGKYGPLGLDIILMPGMKETLISISNVMVVYPVSLMMSSLHRKVYVVLQ